MANRVTFEQKGEVIIAKVSGRVHGTYSNEIDSSLTHAARQGRYLLLDLSELEYIASSGLRIFLKLRNEAMSKGGQVAILHPSENVRKILEVAGFEHLFPMVQTVEEALEHWGINNDIQT